MPLATASQTVVKGIFIFINGGQENGVKMRKLSELNL